MWCYKFLDFDRRLKFWFVLESKSIDFTGVLLDWWVVNRLVLMCYFLIKYGIFGWVREKLYFSRVWWCFWVICGGFWRGRNGLKWRKMVVLSNSLPKWCFGFGLGEMSRKCRFYKEFVDRTDMPVYLANKRSKNVNYAPIYTEQTFSKII